MIFRLKAEATGIFFTSFRRKIRPVNHSLVASAFRRKIGCAGQRHEPCRHRRVPHPYPPHHSSLPYQGKHHYFLTFCTDQRKDVFGEEGTADLVWTQCLRAASKWDCEVTAYCFMLDHVHLIVHGQADGSNAKAFIKSAKQYSGYHFKRRYGYRLWQRYAFERVMRDDVELVSTIGYIVKNPVRAGLVKHPSQYSQLGSQRYTVTELLAICEYREEGAETSA